VFNTTPYFSKALHPLTEVVYSVAPDGRDVFMSSKPGGGGDNPTDPMSLTDQQKRRSVQFVFHDVSHLDLSFGSVGTGSGGRNLLFGCATNIPTPLECNIADSTVSHSNLGGMGPDMSGEQTIVFDNFATYWGNSVSLVIKNLTKYEPKDSAVVTRNGKNGHFGRINVKTATETKLSFEFHIGGTLAFMDTVPFSFFDLDSANRLQANETMGVFNTTPYFSKALDPLTEVVYSVAPDGRDMFTASKPGGGADNPTDPMSLTDLQKRRSVQFVFHGVSHLDLSFGSVGTGSGGRNLLFGCGTNIPTPLQCNIADSTVRHSNLGGMGPDLSADPTIVLDNFATYWGNSVMLVIKNLTKYEPKDSTAVTSNGKDGKFGTINVKTATETKLSFEFQIGGTLAIMDTVPFSFFDLDSDNDLAANETMGVFHTTRYTSKALDPLTEVVYSVAPDGRDMFTSSTPGAGADNPTDPMSLTDQQKRRSVQLVFHSVSHLDLSFGSVGTGIGGRNLLFGCGTNMLA